MLVTSRLLHRIFLGGVPAKFYSFLPPLLNACLGLIRVLIVNKLNFDFWFLLDSQKLTKITFKLFKVLLKNSVNVVAMS